ncbi:MAG: hypothetical protein EBT13_18215, partial [Rhodobacteraceae bacterium]|nr:hypothetical protein [Paracoccaceae bacterium]
MNLHRDYIPVVFSIPGAPEAKVYSQPIVFGRAVTILDVFAAQGTGPTGASNTFDILKGGTSIF